jgi:hypothetical protein
VMVDDGFLTDPVENGHSLKSLPGVFGVAESPCRV